MSLGEAAGILAEADPDRLAALVLLPPAQRAPQIALHALGAELARVPGISDEPMLAAIRLQWWVDELGRLPGSAGLHPLLGALAELPDMPAPEALAALAAGQGPACEDAPFEEKGEVVAWIDATTGALMWIAAQTLGAPPAAEAAVRAQGRALGIARLILRGAARPVPEALHGPLRDFGLAEARAAADAARAVPRAAAPVLTPGPALRAALQGRPPPSEFARRRALAWFVFRRDWRF